jgi:hypothetical protein
MLNERVAKTQFKKVSNNLAKVLANEIIGPVEIDTEVDLIFENPGMLLSRGSQRVFTNIIRSLQVRPYHKSTLINLDRICCAVDKMCGYTPSDPMIWKSIQSTTLQRWSRGFYWKCVHNTFRVGDFWTHIEHLEIIGKCQVCDVMESLEHIALECNSPEQKIIWTLTRELWSRKYDTWPTLNWGLILGCNLVKFRCPKGHLLTEKGRLFVLLVSVGWHLIWNLRVNRVTKNLGTTLSTVSIHNQWLIAINSALKCDQILTDKVKFGTLALKRQLMLSTWSGLLKDEDSAR